MLIDKINERGVCMRVYLQKANGMLVATTQSGVYHTFDENKAENFSEKTIESFVSLKEQLEKRENTELSAVFAA